MTTRLHKQRADLFARLHHARIAHAHTPSQATQQEVRRLTSALRNLDAVITATAHGMVNVSQKYEPSDLFITAAELMAKRGLLDSRVRYL